MKSKEYKRFALQLGANIKRARNNQRLTQQQLADALELSYKTQIVRWESYGELPRLDTLIKICKILKISIAEIIRGC